MKDNLGVFSAPLWFILVVVLSLVLLATAIIYAIVKVLKTNINLSRFMIPGIRLAK